MSENSINAIPDATAEVSGRKMKILVTGGSGFIGTNMMDHFLEHPIDILNIDIKGPHKSAHTPYWRECDIMDKDTLVDIFEAYCPTHVIHLAARTDTEGKRTLDDYVTNTTGTANVLDAVKATPTVDRVIITSTQFVCQKDGMPAHDEDFAPHAVYGQSKVISEQLTRQADLKCIWTIVRPTNIWGPWHPRYPYEFWRILQKGLYLHPGGKPVTRCYGYVGNVVRQIDQILKAPPSLVDGKVYYLGDMPVSLTDWANGFAMALTDKPVRVVPRSILRMLALVGDLSMLFGIEFPIHTSRYRSMTRDNFAPMVPTMAAFGDSPISLDDGIGETVAWLQSQGLA